MRVPLKEMHHSLPLHPTRDLKSPAAPWHVLPRLSCDAADIVGMSGSEAGRRARHVGDVCKYGILKHTPKRLPCHKPRGFTILVSTVCVGLNKHPAPTTTTPGNQTGL